MRVPVTLSQAFGEEFEAMMTRFLLEKGYISDQGALRSSRFLSRSIVPHVKKLSDLFNRLDEASLDSHGRARQEKGLERYWRKTSNPENLRLAYFLYFMPCNLYRVAAIVSELARLGFRWSGRENAPLKGIEFGAGPASGTCGIAAGEHFAPIGLSKEGNWALLEQDRAVLKLGVEWAQEYFSSLDFPQWSLRPFHRKIDFSRPLLPASAPKFNFWLMSYFLNEITESPAEIAHRLLEAWKSHLEDEGIVILVEPALKMQSRKLLEVRQELIDQQKGRSFGTRVQTLLPCIGEQACGALADPNDWCHEEVSWWRPPYMRLIDQMAGLDRKSLAFSYLVLSKTERELEDLLPALKQEGGDASTRYRLVSPAHKVGSDLEFFICGEDGKRRARYKPSPGEEDFQRGDILLDVKLRGSPEATRIESIKKKV